ncbi:putative TBC1 domain family member 2A [Apostichopus japonicus]|uniref:Putative TBC1 domain family member 2A n=1 Tax=Stichopus japonicus TaxID=307972 RepID=A0A2G8JT13_STIJA|nr:putative TBC1 domain family member 2A [Apostichopus japonicus]
MRLPFQGTPEAPNVFRVAGATVSLLRERGVVLYVCLDDWLIVGNSESETANSVYRTISTLQKLGWIVNDEKSRLTPTQTIPFLGGVIDFTIGVAKPWQERINAIASTASCIMSQQFSLFLIWLRSQTTTGKHGRCCKPLQVAHVPTAVMYFQKFPGHKDRDMTTPISRSEEPTLTSKGWNTTEYWSQGVPFTTDLPITG